MPDPPHTKINYILSLFVYFKAIAYLEINNITTVHPVQFINSISDSISISNYKWEMKTELGILQWNWPFERTAHRKGCGF
jgi:hypothetical protein